MKTPESTIQSKPIEYGSGIIVKELDEKIIISAETRLREGNFLIQGECVDVRAGNGIKISSVHPNILVITANTTKMEEKIFDLENAFNKRLENIEKAFSQLLKKAKQ